MVCSLPCCNKTYKPDSNKPSKENFGAIRSDQLPKKEIIYLFSHSASCATEPSWSLIWMHDKFLYNPHKSIKRTFYIFNAQFSAAVNGDIKITRKTQTNTWIINHYNTAAIVCGSIGEWVSKKEQWSVWETLNRDIYKT